jgi:DNA polymerase III epsilon subunit-like protein
MSGLQWFIIDTETNGVNAKYHEINEISIIRCSDRVQLTEFIKCDYPERSNIDALRITKKTLADLSTGKLKHEVVDKIDRFLNEDGLTPAHRCFIAHNAIFDRRFIYALYEKVNKQCPVNLWLCSMALTRAYAKQQGIIKPKVNLQASLDLCGIKKLAGIHASKVDSRNTYLLWKDLVENKKIDYLPFIKTAIHMPKSDENEALDPDLLDIE